MKAKGLAAILACAVMAGAATQGDGVPAMSGYLSPTERPDLTRILAPPPTPGSPRAHADTEIFRETRRLAGTRRWALATADVRGEMLDHFACALGGRIAPSSVPATTRLLARAGEDRSVVGLAKTHFNTRRPYLGTDAPICEPRTDHLAANPDYPSGHAAHGQHVAMILAALVPARATPLLERGRTFAESRYICGSHSFSAAQAGIESGAAVFAAELGSADFRADLERAREELSAALAAAPAPSGCT